VSGEEEARRSSLGPFLGEKRRLPQCRWKSWAWRSWTGHLRRTIFVAGRKRYLGKNWRAAYAGTRSAAAIYNLKLKPSGVKDSGRAGSQALRRTSPLLRSLPTRGLPIRRLGGDLNWTGRRP
jgi:hypothetical protein